MGHMTQLELSLDRGRPMFEMTQRWTHVREPVGHMVEEEHNRTTTDLEKAFYFGR